MLSKSTSTSTGEFTFSMPPAATVTVAAAKTAAPATSPASPTSGTDRDNMKNASTMASHKDPTATTTTTFTFEAFEPAADVLDLHNLNVRASSASESSTLSHPLLGQLALVIRTGLAGPEFLNTHLVITAKPAPPKSSTIFAFHSTRITFSVSLQVSYNDQGDGPMIPLVLPVFATPRGAGAAAAGAQAACTSDQDSTPAAAPPATQPTHAATPLNTGLVLMMGSMSFDLPASSPPPVGTVYTCTMPHASLYFSSSMAANQIRISSASVTLSSHRMAAAAAPAFQLPVSTPATGPLGLLSSLNQPHLCDTRLLPKDAKEPIHVSRAVLACASPYFRSMFSGHWAETTVTAAADTIDLPYPAHVVLPCLVHMYTQWTPRAPLPTAAADLARKFKADVVHLDRHGWQDVMDLADMWGLDALVLGANRALVGVLNAQYEARTRMAAGESLGAGMVMALVGKK